MKIIKLLGDAMVDKRNSIRTIVSEGETFIREKTLLLTRATEIAYYSIFLIFKKKTYNVTSKINNYFVLQIGLNKPQNWFNSDFFMFNYKNLDGKIRPCIVIS